MPAPSASGLLAIHDVDFEDTGPHRAVLPNGGVTGVGGEHGKALCRNGEVGRWAALALVMAAAALFLGGCGSKDGQGPVESTVEVAHGDFWVTSDPDSVEEGKVTFEVANKGAIIHEFKVIKTDLPPDDLPLNEDEFVVDETQVDVRGFTDLMKPGETRTLILDMPPGKYVFICNVPSHYQAGSYVGFQVVVD